jgi:hypothetical protein
VWRAQAATGFTGLDEAFGTPERDSSSVELEVRDARLTDIGRIIGPLEPSDAHWPPRMLLPLVRSALAIR